MNKVLFLTFVVITLLGSIGLTGCGSNTSTVTSQQTTQTSVSQTTSATSETHATTTVDYSNLWADMPVYPGANQIQKGSWAVPPADDSEYAKFEWRYYETTASVGEVSGFYDAKMSSNGWETMAWMEMGEVNWGMYNKNSENDAAMVWISSDEGKTVIAMWRATR